MSKPFDLEEFKAFVASKPGDEEYCPSTSFHCALAQFGFPSVFGTNCEVFGIPYNVFEAAIYDWPDDAATFGALADRLSTLRDHRV